VQQDSIKALKGGFSDLRFYVHTGHTCGELWDDALMGIRHAYRRSGKDYPVERWLRDILEEDRNVACMTAEMASAVLNEQYEKAAQLRDAIEASKGKSPLIEEVC